MEPTKVEYYVSFHIKVPAGVTEAEIQNTIWYHLTGAKGNSFRIDGLDQPSEVSIMQVG